MSLRLCLGRREHLHGDERETLLLEALNDLTNQLTLDSIRLDGDERALEVGASDTLRRDLASAGERSLSMVDDGGRGDGDTGGESGGEYAAASDRKSGGGRLKGTRRQLSISTIR
jgi:hypothetical protein